MLVKFTVLWYESLFATLIDFLVSDLGDKMWGGNVGFIEGC